MSQSLSTYAAGWMTHESKTLGDAVRGGARITRLDLAGVDLGHNGPSSAVRQAKGEHAHDNNPLGRTIGVHDARGIKRSDQQHKCRQA